MVRRVYFHIGAPKTGTSYLQELLFRNRSSLESQGILYAASRPSDQFRAMLDLRGVDWHGHSDPAVSGAWDRIARRSRRWPGTVLFSEESLAVASREQARRAILSVQPAEVHVVYTVRDLGRMIASAWQQTIRTSGRKSFDQYLDLLEQSRVTKRNAFWRTHDLPAVLRRWGADLPPRQIHIVTVPGGESAENLWKRFCLVLEVDPSTLAASSEPKHASLGFSETNLLRQVNNRLDGRLKFPLYGELISRWLAEDVLAQRTDSLPVVLPSDRYAWVHAQAQQYIDVVRSRGYDVVGDLETLLPLAPSESAELLNGASQEKQLEAGLDVIAALLLAAARERQHPVGTFLQHSAQAIANGHRVPRWLTQAITRIKRHGSRGTAR